MQNTSNHSRYLLVATIRTKASTLSEGKKVSSSQPPGSERRKVKHVNLPSVYCNYPFIHKDQYQYQYQYVHVCEIEYVDSFVKRCGCIVHPWGICLPRPKLTLSRREKKPPSSHPFLLFTTSTYVLCCSSRFPVLDISQVVFLLGG